MKSRKIRKGLVQHKATPAVMQQKLVEKTPLQEDAGPLLIRATMSGILLQAWLHENKNEVRDLLNQYGGILFRGFAIDTKEKFKSLVDHLELHALEYTMRSSPRYEVGDKVYHSTTYPADRMIQMHTESSYAMTWPMKALFCCITPAEVQGETPVADTRQVLKRLSPELKGKFSRLGVKYVRNLSRKLGLSWQEVFQTEDKNLVEAECIRNHMCYTWKSQEELRIEWNKQAIYTHPYSGELVWFNHAFFFNQYTLSEHLREVLDADSLPFNTSFGDGSPISRQEFEELKNAWEQSMFVFPWQKGDVLFLDNMLMAHGRMPFQGKRQILVSLLEPMSEKDFHKENQNIPLNDSPAF
ncbi:TauD/TfdA family dioxygenase [Rapidithrix thailandica]|uniref:TauD/TfdA family dioxygenase n=1 Tax=Rapidithrix thailandica TaxID=413964 RepID=A0AAW9S911_9BACT